MPRGGIPGSYHSSIFSFFEEPPYWSSQWLYQFTFPPTVKESSLFSTASPAFVTCRCFHDSHSDRCEVTPHYSFDLHFSINEHLFLCLLVICVSSLEKFLFSSFTRFSDWVIFFILNCMSCFIYFGNRALVTEFSQDLQAQQSLRIPAPSLGSTFSHL